MHLENKVVFQGEWSGTTSNLHGVQERIDPKVKFTKKCKEVEHGNIRDGPRRSGRIASLQYESRTFFYYNLGEGELQGSNHRPKGSLAFSWPA